MITETSHKKELLAAIDEAVSELQALMSSLDENKINTVPYKDSWTPAQLLRHVTKSINGMAKAMGMDAEPADRGADERIPDLKKAFLDFSNKMKSPDFIVPEPGPFKKQEVTEKLNKSFGHLKESAANANLIDLVANLPLGPITKLEILHFTLYHTQRHLHQMQNICAALENGTPA